MIYGDREYGEGEKKVADIRAINQTLNLYAYCISNPEKYVGSDGEAAAAIAEGLQTLALISQLAAQKAGWRLDFRP